MTQRASLFVSMALACAALACDAGGGDPGPEVERTAQALVDAAGAPSAEPVLLSFERGWNQVVPARPLVGGDVARIQFDTNRFYDAIRGGASYSWFASAHHCYGYGCCEVAFPEVGVHTRFASDQVFEDRSVSLDTRKGAGVMARTLFLDVAIPQGAERLEVWFSVPGYDLHGWYCGCDSECSKQSYEQANVSFHAYDAYDSVYGMNYVFPVGQ